MKVIGWIDYDNFNFATAEGTEEEITAVVQEIKQKGYKFGGDDHENISCCCPLLSNGTALRLSWRAWGKIMAMAYDIKTENDDYNYIIWYMGEYAPESRVFPNKTALDYKSAPAGKTFIYELSDEEYASINNCEFCSLVLPIEFYDTINLKTFDKITLKYSDKIILDTVINDVRFCRYALKELFTEDSILKQTPSYNTNYKNFTIESARAFIQSKFNLSSDGLISIGVDFISDNRNPQELY